MRILIIAAVAIYVLYLVRVVIDLFRRHDLTTIREGRLDDLAADHPLHHLMIYLMVRPPRMAGQR